jgi:hypothetical protein
MKESCEAPHSLLLF